MKLKERIADVKFYIQHNQKKFILMMCSVVIMGGLVAGTLAWLSSMSGPIINNFIGSELEIDLAEVAGEVDEETGEHVFQMIPHLEISKNPVVTVKADSEACWLFLQVKESKAQANGSGITVTISGEEVARTGSDYKYLEYGIRDSWTPMTETEVTQAGFPTETDGSITYYYCKVGDDGTALASDEERRILVDDKVTVRDCIINQELSETQLTTNPVTISFKPVAVQRLGFETVVAAGQEVSTLF